MKHEHCGTFGDHRRQRLVRLTDGGFAGVDPCIFDLVQALNNAGYRTVASCCGHGEKPGVVSLEDGRSLLVGRWDAETQQLLPVEREDRR